MQNSVLQGFRLSPRQQHLWWAQGAAGSPTLVVQTRIAITGALDPRRLKRALERAAERHEILRTTFPLLPSLSVPVQSVDDSAAVDWSVRETPFDLANGPLLRAALIETGTDLHALVLTQPALAADGVSLDLLAAEIAAAYHGRPLDGEVLQYADLAELLHDWQGAPAEEPGPAFWRGQDLSALVRVTLGAGLPGGERISRRIERAPVAAAAARLGTSISVILLAAWHAALHLSTGAEEIIVGTLFDGRTCEELETALGPFAHYLPVAARASVDSTLAELSRALSFTLTEISRRQDFFSAEPVEKLLAEHGLAGWPFGFDVRQPPELPAAPGAPPFTTFAKFTIVDGHLDLDRFGLRLSIFDDGRSLRAELTDAVLLERFCRVLDGLLAGLPLGEVDILTEAERRQVLDFNRTESEIPADLCAHHLFEERARLAPHAPAVIHARTVWTYAELNARANRIAHHLRAAGLGPGSLVGLSLARSPELVAAVLGILKAGAAYVPFDPGSPAERLAWMAEDAGISLLLTQENIVSAPREDDPPRTAGPDDLAYVIYTSGSTGRPKGVMIPHRGLVNYLLWARQAYAAGAGAGAPVHSALGFDLTVTSLLVPLAAGSAVTLLPEHSPLEALAAALRGAPGFSLVKLTPAHLDGLRSELRPEEHAGATRALVIGGEALRAESVAPWREQAPETRLINEYGPTEATVGCCVHEIVPGDPMTGPVPIGRPIANTRLHVVGPRLQPVPLGAPGELLIGGDGLARGYLGRPELTAERFVPDPGKEGERLYRTGDLVRLRPDGNLEFLGRIDHQIKIRGFRIEPGEIEAALVAHPDVREAAVLAGGADLVACIAGNTGNIDTAALRRHLLGRLPEPMVPSRFVVFEALPLTSNGKVDRKELTRTWRERADAAAEPAGSEAPRSWTEELLAGMFAELLGLPRVGRGESFFALGGHSLLATQAVSRIRAAFGVEMTLRALFEAPTVAALAGKVEALRARGEAPVAPPLVSTPRVGSLPLPLSFAQQRLWFIDQLAPGSPLYNIPLALRVEGPLEVEILARCLGEIVRRHEALRTVFIVQDGAPAQVIQPAAPFELPTVDLSALPQERRETAALTLAGTEAARPFDLARGPLLRGLLLRSAPQDSVVALTMHHIASDGWSIAILVREVMALYAAFAAGRPSPLPELTVQYADFSRWQQSWLHGAVLESEIAFWREQLAGLPPRLDLPTDRPRPAVQSFRGAMRSFRLPAELTRQAEALSRRDGATLFMVLLAGLQALLARWSDQQDLAVGTTIAGRNRIETEGLIGFFVNTLVLRGDLAGEPTFRELLARARDTALAAHAHQDVPFERLIQVLAPERSLAQTPLFQVMFMVQNTPVESLEIEDLRLRPVGGAGTTAKFDLTLSLGEQAGGLNGTAEYATDLFDAATIDRLLGQYERLLGEALAAPERTSMELPLLSSAEQHQVLVEWNDTAVDLTAEATLIHQPFEAWARRTPGATAAVCGGEVLTYGEVEEQANRLADHLVTIGIGPGALVGIHLRRSLAMIPALLAVLKAGAAYVPLEIGHPPARLRWILGTLEISCLLTETAQLAAVRALEVPELSEMICVDRPEGFNGPIGQIRPIRPISPRPTPNDLAYIIFTSGSTGTPKGVMVRHRPVMNLLRWAHRTFAFSPADRVLSVASLAFDLSVFDIFGLLAAGGSIRIATEDEIRDPQLLLKALAEEPITFWDSAPAALEQTVPFLGGLDPQDDPAPAALRLVFLSGDWIPVTLPDRIRARFPGARIVSLGGATEATVWSNVFPIGAVDPAWVSIPYGRPIDNARYHVLDARLAPCPVGVPGDLYIGGDCLADGYAREPELTAQKFIPDPSGGRLYRTGDRARYRPDGTLEFLGRRDSQVKIRGFRIELGEIEVALASLSGVREAVVAVRENRLIAYVTGDVIADTTLREALCERLPEPMIPSAFVKLDVLPLTANGKVDRKALPAPEWQRSAEHYIAPRTPVEEGLAAIWTELLSVSGGGRIGADDHFFELGGHSLLATQVVSRLHSSFGVELPLRDLFEAPVLADLAARVEAARRGGARLAAPPLVPLVPRQGPFPLSFAQQRLWLIEQLDPGSPRYNIPLALRVAGPLDSAMLARCLGEIVRRHEALRTVFPGTAQLIQPAAPFVLPVVDLTELPESRREALAVVLAGEEAVRPFDLVRGPLLRGILVRLAATDHVAALTMHHIASDGWSIGILVREVSALYTAFAHGRPSPLPELPVQYADFAVWQQSWLQGEVLESEIAFWRRQLAGLPPLLELPIDRPRPAVQSFRGASRPVRLPAALSRRMQTLGRSEGATLFMVLLAGFQALLARYSGQRDLAVGTPVAGRNRRETEGLIGFFVNTLVLRADLSGEPTFRELLARTRDTALAAQMRQDLPFEKLVQELAPERTLAHSPLFQVMLALHNVPLGSLEIESLRLRPLSVSGTVAKLDLMLGLEERPDGAGLTGAVEHATALFDATTIDRLIGHFDRLLTAAVDTPDAAAFALPLLSAPESAQLLVEWNDTRRDDPDDPEDLCLHDLFAASAALRPDAVAAVFEGDSLTYGELAARADALADRLRAAGTGPETLVGICLDESLERLVAMLGVFLAGAAYLPLDPGYPRERLDGMIADAGVRLVLTPETLRGGLPVAAGAPGSARPHNLAYVIYTSGSTGRPNGVMVTHGAAVRVIRSAIAEAGLGPHTRGLHYISFSFDPSILETWTVLAAGGTLCIAPREARLSTEVLARLILREGITYTLGTPSTLAALPTDLPALDTFLVGAERCPAEVARRWAPPALGLRHLFNSYGPTEATIYTASADLQGADLRRHREPPIGRPVADSRIYVLDPDGRPVPVGAHGELTIVGPGLARGYLNRPALTAERFVPDPFGEAGARLYRTGDLARWLPDGNLDFLGRVDGQVKLRGLRIELGEIEAALAAQPGVREAVAIVREDTPGDRRLVAYLVGTPDSAATLRRLLRDRLPDALVPADFVTLPALPLTPNGKVDRKALPAPGPHGAEGGPESHLAPRTPVEEVIAGIWSELLGGQTIGAGGHFFELGGHSLLAAQVVSRLRSAFGVDIPLRDLFEAPVLADLAARVEAALQAGAGLAAPPLLPVAQREGPFPLSLAQQRLWLTDQLAPGSPLYNMPLALRVEGPLDSRVLALCLGEIARRHEALRTVFALGPDGAPVQAVRPAEPFALPVVDLAGLPAPQREALAMGLTGEEADRPFDLARGPLLRGLLLRLEQESCVTALTMHHIVSDGWSLGILVREVSALYAALAAGRPSPLPELGVQYADFAVWQHSWLHGEVLENEIAYWRRQLAGLPPLLTLPTDRPRPAVQSFRGASRPVRLPAALTRQAQTLSRTEGATLFMVLLAAFQSLLSRTSGQQDLAVGSSVAGRNRAETEGLIGFFVNTLVLRGHLSKDPTFRDLLARARETTLAAHLHQDVPLERIVQELTPERSLDRSPLFQVLLVLHNAPVETLEIRNLRLRPVDGSLTMAKFDLTLSLGEQNGALAGTVQYATDLFDETTIDRLIGHLERLLTAALEAPQQTAEDLPLLSSAERHQLVEWNDTAAFPLSREAGGGWERGPGGEGPLASLPDRFFAAAARWPQAVALHLGEATLTYGELVHRVRRRAAGLRGRGVGPETVTALRFERSFAMVETVLAVLAAGGAFVALDPHAPQARTAALLAEVRPVLLLDDLDDSMEPPAAEPALPAPPDPAALAYLAFTSGSTGAPKGILGTHGALAGYLDYLDAAWPLAPEDRVLQLARLSFDASFRDLVYPLTRGAAVVLLAGDEARDPAALLRETRAHEVTCILSAVPSLLHALVESAVPQKSDLRLILASGEPLPLALCRRLREVFGNTVRIANQYGPSECTLTSTVQEVAADATVGTALAGRPIPGMRCRVLDARLQQVPLGVVGQVFLGGAGITRGYLGRPDLTAERFLPDPFTATPGERLYATGDLGRLRPAGALELLGRIDTQVKIRGIRLELGEVEAALAAHPETASAVAAVRDGRLVAYVVGRGGKPPQTDNLRSFLEDRLPEHAVPSLFVPLPALPLNANGKVDRKALPAPDWKPATESYLAPRTPVEEVIAAIWAEALGLERVGTGGNFFALGGHSLLATWVIVRLRKAFAVDLPLRALFDAPTVAGLAARVETALRAGQDRLTPPLVRDTGGQEPRPLSFAQQRLWLIDQLDPGSALYNMPVALRVEGPLDSAVLARGLGEIVRRHETLRTVFSTLAGSPVQVIQPATPFALPVVDLAGLPEHAREAATLALASGEAARPFDLQRGPLLRAVLVRLGLDDHVLALTVHHIVSDGWSMGLLIREVTALYTAFAAGRPSPLPELPVQYADFAAWQRSWLHGEALENEIAFWRHQLTGLPPLLTLPTDRPRPAAQSFRGTSRPVRLPSALTAQAQALGRSEGATLFMVLLAAFQALLARLSGQQDLAVGAPEAGRNRVEIEGLIGFFVNTLVLRGELKGEPALQELIKRARETVLAAHTHQDVPFEKLVQELEPERSLAHTPLFQVVLALQNAPVESVDLRSLRLRPVETAATTAKFDLTLHLAEPAEPTAGLSGLVTYATDLFDATTIDRLMVHFETLLTAALAAPDAATAELPLLTAAERHQVQAEWGGLAAEPPADSIPLHQLHRRFTAQARRTPDAPALTCEGAVMSYGELDRRSDQLARRLRAAGAGPAGSEYRVGLCLERSLDLVVGLLGILKAGGAYVPLDPAAPRERLAFMIEDSGVETVVAAPETASALPETVRRIFVADPGPDREPLEALPAGDLAYVIYTSGSTGRPKGALVTHANVTRLFDATEPWFGFTAQDVWTLFHSYAFDFSVWEIWGALLHGGRLVIVPFEVSRSPDLFLDLLVRERVTVLNQTPSAFTQLAQADACLPSPGDGRGEPGEGPGVRARDLRLVIFGGEALDPASLAPWFERHGDERPRLVNMYGITETTVHVTYRPLSIADTRGVRRSAIGVPIPDLSLAVMDPSLRPAPLGVPGELVVGGAGLARGYLGRPELTAEHFVPDPAGGFPGARLYRSGDLGRFLPTGDVESLGRIDHQVKIRGFRIELGEIEALLAAQPGVREAVVTVREDRSGDRRLVAYVAGDVSADALRRALRERLPEYMVPTAFVTLDALPLTANGKVDRKALPAPEQQSAEDGFVAPRTPVEEILAGLWADLLGFSAGTRIGVDAHFFDLGGHSLLATRLVAAVRDVFRVDLPLRLLFERPTLEGLAQVIAEAQESGALPDEIELVALPRLPGENRFPVSLPQLDEYLLDRKMPGNPILNIPSPLRIEGPLAVPALIAALQALVRRHEVFRTRFELDQDEPLQIVQPEVRLEVPVIDLSALPDSKIDSELQRLADTEAATILALSAAPLLRTRIVRRAAEDHTLLLTVRHIIADGWSMGVLLREVAALYEAAAQGVSPSLPPLPVQYADFAAWQRRRLGRELLKQQESFWRQRLAGAPPHLALPTDRPRPPVQSNRAGQLPFQLPQPLADGLEELARRSGATLFMVLLAGLQTLLGRWSGQDDIVVGTYRSDRPRRQLEALIGFFVTTLPLRTCLAEAPTFAALLGRVRDTTLEAYAHSDLPFHHLLDALDLPSDPSRTPLFQASLVLHSFPPARIVQGAGLRLSGMEAPDSAYGDLELLLATGPEGVTGLLKYSADLFDEATMVRFAAELRALLTAAVEDPERDLRALALNVEPTPK